MNRERLLLGLALAALPALIYGLAIRPVSRRIAALKGRIAAARAEARPAEPFTPVTPEERKLLTDPAAPWRARIPMAADEGERLALADRVLSGLAAALRERGARVLAVRARFDPVKADFTPPLEALPRPAPERAAPDSRPEDAMAGWVLELELAGDPGQLFKALGVAAGMEPLLEPVGLRWMAMPGKTNEPGATRQSLLFRGYYLKP
jgi:hypothetical protein